MTISCSSNRFEMPYFHAVIFSVSSSFFAMDTRCTLSDGKIMVIYRNNQKLVTGVFRTVRTEAYRRYYPYRTLRLVRYDINTVIPDTSETSVRHQYRGTSGTGMDVCTVVGTGISTASIPLPTTSVSSVRRQPGTPSL